jgi:hypothetical protein
MASGDVVARGRRGNNHRVAMTKEEKMAKRRKTAAAKKVRVRQARIKAPENRSQEEARIVADEDRLAATRSERQRARRQKATASESMLK